MKMIKFLLALSILAFPGLNSSGTTAGPVQHIFLYDLRCEDLTNPLGIATTTPGLSWKIRSDRNGTEQTAFQIIAASDSSLLNENSSDIWNSGRVISASGIFIQWAGKKLESGSFIYWKVRIWDDKNQVSEWSKIAFFSVGLLSDEDWKAKYIGMRSKLGNSVCPLLRKSFNLSGEAQRRILYVNSLGYHEVYLNGKKVGDAVLAPAVSQFSKRSLSIAYDVSGYLHEGKNDLIIWLGSGWYSPGLPGVTSDVPLVKAEIEELKSGKWDNLVSTDSTWVGRESGYSGIGKWRANNFGGEKVDGSLILPDLSPQSLEKVPWYPVFEADVPEHQVTPQTSEFNKIQETLKPLKVIPFGYKTWLVDMGKTLTGWAEINFPPLQEGQEVIMEYCDHLEKDNQFVNQHQEDRYIAKGLGLEKFCNKFNYHGFRYIRISNLSVEPGKENIKAFLIHTAFRKSSSFKCSDSDLNSIHDMLSYTLRCLSLGGYLVDCPQFERLGYGGDGNASTQTAQTMFDLGPLYSNWLQAWADCIRDDGGMPHTAPNPYPAGGGPYWCGFIITASWKTFQNYGDIRVLEKYYSVMQKWLEYVAKFSSDGLLKPWPSTNYREWYLGDWATPEGVDQKNKESVDMVNNCFIVQCLETMQKIALRLGKTVEAGEYAIQSNRLKKKIHDTFFNSTINSYASGSQTDLAFALLSQIVPDSLIKNVTSVLNNEILVKHNGHLAVGLVGIPVFTEWTIKNHDAGLLCNMLKKKDYPGYLYMIENGATTTWEHWRGTRSRIHNCYNGVGSWFYQAVGGIRPDEDFPGYQQVFIDPQIPEGITWAETTKETPYGTLTVKWHLEKDLLKLNIDVPVGCKAKVVLPGMLKKYQINGQTYKTRENPSVAVIGSGKYSLSFSR